MSTINVFDSSTGMDVQERLYIGVGTGPLEQYKGLLEDLEDVDVRGVGQRTLLHQGVNLGKLDWVEALLRKGADPCLRDKNHYNALDMAEEMSVRCPEDEDRQDILRLVQVVHIGREIVMSRRRASLVVHVDGTPSTAVSHEMAEVSPVNNSMNSIKTELSCHTRMMVPLEDMKKALSERDALLESLESATKSSAEVLTGVKKRLEDFSVSWDPPRAEDLRRDCVDSMMGRTKILNMDERKISLARSFYENIYDGGEDTLCLLKFLRRFYAVEVLIDCDSRYIGGMKSPIKFDDGVEWNGNIVYSFADFSESNIYLGGKVEHDWMKERVISMLAVSMARMSLFLAYDNDGRPYERGDVVHELQFKRALEEAEEKRKMGVEMDWEINWALDRKSHLGKEIELTSVVPWVIARHGYTSGATLLRTKVPSILDFYRHHVMPTLRRKARA